ncbi:MAG: hypothetical protein JSS33_10680 [Proteobacteria bacterium]|nr:hypothetical protein [Pseudomonadota bacterium]
MRYLIAILSAFALCAILYAIPSQAQPNSLSVTLQLAGLPGTITLCRDPAAGQNGTDEQWSVPIDVDSNPNTPTGSNAIPGAEVVLLAETLPQYPGCQPTSAVTANSIIAGVLVWNAAQNNYIDSGQSAIISIGMNSFTIVTDISGVLGNLSTASKYFAASMGSYSVTGSGATSTFDNTNEISIDNSVTSTAGNVQNCVAPGCNSSSSWYPLVDLVGLSSSTTSPLPSPPPPPQPPPPFGANTVDAEFDLTSLPASVNMCPGNRSGYGYDLIWIAGMNYNTTLGAYETLITAHTPMVYGCGGILSLAPLYGTLFHMDPNNPTNGYTSVTSLPVTVDTAHGKILVQADRTNPYLAALSSSTLVKYFTYEEVSTSATGDFSPIGLAAGLFQTYPQDTGSQFNFGSSFITPSNNVCTSSSSCTSPAYPQIDLISGTMHMDDYIFRNGFDP